MGQLIIKYKSNNPGTRKIKVGVALAPNDVKEVNSQTIQELVLEGNGLFVRKQKATTVKIVETNKNA